MLVDSLALGDFQAWFSLHLVNWPDSNIMNKIMVLLGVEAGAQVTTSIQVFKGQVRFDV